MLRIVNFIHYLTFPTQLAVAAAFSAHGAELGASLPVLLTLGPVLQAAGGAGPNMMHEYEGWEVRVRVRVCVCEQSGCSSAVLFLRAARLLSPSLAPAICVLPFGSFLQVAPFAAYPDKHPETQRTEQNNDALRQVAYRSLFQLQAVGGAMVGLGALWPAAWPSTGAWALLGALGLATYLAPRNVFYGSFSLGGKVELLMPPLPVYPLVLFIGGVSLQLLGLCHLFGPGLGIGITALLSAGGLLEAGLAEGVYDQRWHMLALVLLNTGGLLQVVAVNNSWGSPAFQAVMAAVVLGVAVMMLPPGGAIPELIHKLNSDPPTNGAAHQSPHE
jgi:hypothetical protein